MSRQRASALSTASRSVSRISWSSAPRLSGFEMRSRRTSGAGSSTSSLPDASSATLFEDDKRVALRYGLALLDEDLLHGAVVLRLDGHLHLHRLEDRDGVALGRPPPSPSARGAGGPPPGGRPPRPPPPPPPPLGWCPPRLPPPLPPPRRGGGHYPRRWSGKRRWW